MAKEIESYFGFLDELKESGIVTMHGARFYLLSTFPELDDGRAITIISRWILRADQKILIALTSPNLDYFTIS